MSTLSSKKKQHGASLLPSPQPPPPSTSSPSPSPSTILVLLLVIADVVDIFNVVNIVNVVVEGSDVVFVFCLKQRTTSVWFYFVVLFPDVCVLRLDFEVFILNTVPGVKEAAAVCLDTLNVMVCMS